MVILGHLEVKASEIQDHSAFILNAASRLHLVQLGTRQMLLKVRSGANVSGTDAPDMVRPGGGLLAQTSKGASQGGTEGEMKKKGLRERLIALTLERDQLQKDVEEHQKQHQAQAALGEVHQDNPRDEQMAAILSAEAEEIRRGLRWALEEERRALQEQQSVCVIS